MTSREGSALTGRERAQQNAMDAQLRLMKLEQQLGVLEDDKRRLLLRAEAAERATADAYEQKEALVREKAGVGEALSAAQAERAALKDRLRRSDELRRSEEAERADLRSAVSEHAATVDALEPTELVVVAKHAFESVLGPLRELVEARWRARARLVARRRIARARAASPAVGSRA